MNNSLLGVWLMSSFGECFSSIRRMQFDSNKQLSLLDETADQQYHPENNIKMPSSNQDEITRNRQIAKQQLRKKIKKEEYESFMKRDTRFSQPQDQSKAPVKNVVKEKSEIIDADKPELNLLDDEDVEHSTELCDWLSKISSGDGVEYRGYADGFKSQGFMSLEDVGQLDADDIDDALDAVGIFKYVHRSKIRKAILSLDNQ